MAKTPSIPTTQGLDPVTKNVLDPLIEVVESMKGRRRSGRIAVLPENATLVEVIAKVNEMLGRLQE